jgi:hypothetical protein
MQIEQIFTDPPTPAEFEKILAIGSTTNGNFGKINK